MYGMNRLFQSMNYMPNMMNSPQLAEVMKELQENGGDARSLFFKKAKEMGVDPNTILSQLGGAQPANNIYKKEN